MTAAFVSALYVYPIKSCGAVALDSVRLEKHGFDGDRRYMLALPDGGFISQRTHPTLAQIRSSLSGERIGAAAPGLSPLDLPRRWDEGAPFSATIWRDEVRARVHAEGSAWFSEFLGEPVVLVYLPDQDLRQVDPKRAEPGDRVGFADAYPLLLTSESSLVELNRSTTEQVPMNRFRPNVVVSGWPPFFEDDVSELHIGDIALVMPKLCDRCVVTTTDQLTGERGAEPLRALARTRRWDQKVWFGANLIPRGAGVLALGQPVTPSVSRARES